MSGLRTIAVKSLDSCEFYFQGQSLTLSFLEIRIKVLLVFVKQIKLEFYLSPEEARKLHSWNIFPNIEISDDMIELRLMMFGRLELGQQLRELYSLHKDVNPAELLLYAKNDEGGFEFRDFKYYSCFYSMLATNIPNDPLFEDDWKWEWYDPENITLR